MIHIKVSKTLVTTSIVTLLLAALSAPGFAKPDQARVFGVGFPKQLADLPPGRAKSRLAQLPPAAQQQAVQWLQRFSFPEADLSFLRFDDQGGVLYVDEHVTEFTQTTESSATPAVSGIEPEDTFKLHSRAGAARTVYLDFDGHTITGTAWNSGMPDPLYARPFDVDGIPASFNADELRRIQEIWHRVAEDFAPFDIDVTTEDPGGFSPNTGRILITHNVDVNNNLMPYSNAGGVAYVGVFGSSQYETYSPALVYYNNLGNGHAPYVAEAASHEFGHNLNLGHDGRGDPYNESYYTGHGPGYVSWAPIMGVGYYTNVTQWSNGNYAASNNTQDDLSIISTRLGFRADDHSDDMSSATPLRIERDGTILVTNPETENHSLPSSANKGIIETNNDVDYFMMDVDAGMVELTVQPAWAAFYRDSLRGANLDVSITLFDLSGQTIASSDPTNNTDASISVIVDAGSYYLAVSGVGNTVAPYSDYASLGQYFISGSVVATTIDPPTAPANLTASALTYEQVRLAWQDGMNETDLRIERSFDQVNWTTLTTLIANSNGFDDHGLNASTTYFYRVIATNSAGEAESNVASATTPDALTVPTAPSNVSAIDGSDGTAIIQWFDASDNEANFEVQVEKMHRKRGTWQGTSIAGTTAADDVQFIHNSGSGNFRYRVRALNAAGSSPWSAWAEVVVSDGGSSGGNGGGKGGGKCNPRKGSC